MNCNPFQYGISLRLATAAATLVSVRTTDLPLTGRPPPARRGAVGRRGGEEGWVARG
ncbi:hypothetical protein ACWDRB_59465 [Nonomuraea sp. NPDC003707]